MIRPPDPFPEHRDQMVAVVEGASTIQLTFRRSTVTAHDAPRPEPRNSVSRHQNHTAR